jgi:hypothetical protein
MEAGVEDRGGAGRFDSFIERFELVIAILLGLAAIVGAVAAYQTGAKDGDTLTAFQEGNRTSDLASRLKTEAAAKRAEDQVVTTFAVQATVTTIITNKGQGGKAAAELGKKLIDLVGSPELKTALTKCDADPACGDTPPIDSKYYVVKESTDAVALDKKATALFASAGHSSKQGDHYSLVTIFLATSLFLYGVAAVARGRSIKLGMASVGFVIFLIGLVLMAVA